jgi:hypothetical protein
VIPTSSSDQGTPLFARRSSLGVAESRALDNTI